MPDYTFYLPQSKTINMDVKFPLDNYKKYVESDDDIIKENSKNEFLKDVKKHIKAITNRSYINPAEGTVDYVLMFIPNESIYSFILENEKTVNILEIAFSTLVIQSSILVCLSMYISFTKG